MPLPAPMPPQGSDRGGKTQVPSPKRIPSPTNAVSRDGTMPLARGVSAAAFAMPAKNASTTIGGKFNGRFSLSGAGDSPTQIPHRCRLEMLRARFHTHQRVTGAFTPYKWLTGPVFAAAPGMWGGRAWGSHSADRTVMVSIIGRRTERKPDENYGAGCFFTEAQLSLAFLMLAPTSVRHVLRTSSL